MSMTEQGASLTLNSGHLCKDKLKPSLFFPQIDFMGVPESRSISSN